MFHLLSRIRRSTSAIGVSPSPKGVFYPLFFFGPSHARDVKPVF
jgi:hypothetical protein